jgi:RNA polymerase sigma-70 factor (ECF subfamily)
VAVASWYGPVIRPMEKSGTPRDRRLRFEQTALPYLDAIYTAALRLSHNPDDAKDLLQETVLRAYRGFHQFKPGTNCRAWLLTILYNTFRTAYRRGAREQLANTNEEFEQEIENRSFADHSPRDNPERMVAERMTGHLIEQALDTIPKEFREALLLVDLHELNYHEVAEVLEIPIGTVKSRVSRGRALMRCVLDKLSIASGKNGARQL